METPEFNALLQECIEQDKKIGDAKGADYTIGSSDRLNNFKTVGELVCCPHCQKPVGPRAVWAVYILKHMLALLAWVKTGKVESEGLAGRVYDVRLYGALGLAIAKEQQAVPEVAGVSPEHLGGPVEAGPGVREGSVWHFLAQDGYGGLERRTGPKDRRSEQSRDFYLSDDNPARRRSSRGRRSNDVKYCKVL